MFIADEGDLRESMLMNLQEYKERSRNASTFSVKGDKVKIKIDHEIIYKETEAGGGRKHFFVVKVFNSIKQQISRVEKTYQDFKGFAASLEYNLREKGIRAPKLSTNNMFETLMASSDEMFKNLDNMENENLTVED